MTALPTLVLMRHPHEVESARALLAALPDLPCRLLFANEELRTQLGPTEHESSTDLASCLVDPAPVGSVICFSAAREVGRHSNLLFLSFFDEVGIPSVELQSDLLADPDRLRMHSAASRFVAWGGEDGVGYLRSVCAREPDPVRRDGLVLVSSALDHSAYTDQERHHFAFALLRLAREQRDRTFVWCLTRREQQESAAAPLLEMVRSLGGPNVFVEEFEPAASVAARAGAVITMASTALLDFAALSRPTLVFAGSNAARLASSVRSHTFETPAELCRAFASLSQRPSDFVPEIALPPLDARRLREILSELAAQRRLSSAWNPIAMRYLAMWQDSRLQGEVQRLHKALGELDRRFGALDTRLTAQDQRALSEHKRAEAVAQRLAELEQQAKTNEQGGKRLEARIDKLLERVGALQRSTLAYKARKALKRLQKPSTSS